MSKKAERSARPNVRPFRDFSKILSKYGNVTKFQYGYKIINFASLKSAFSPIDRGHVELSPGFFPASERF